MYTASYSEADANVTVASVQVDVTGGQDLAGNTQAPSSQPGAFTIDTQNPTLTVNIVAASLSDTTNGSNVTFTFSEAPGASFTDSDVVTAGGTLSALVMDTPTTYHATFTATDGVTTTGSVSVAAGAYTDPVGNLGGAGSDTVSIDTQNPTLTVNIVAASLSDTTNSSNVTFTFSEAPGASFTDSDVVTAGGTLSALVMDTPTTYHATFTATDGVTTTGSVSVAAGAYTDPVGNLGAPARTPFRSTLRIRR